MNVTLVTTWQIPCGIAEYAGHLVGAWPWYRELPPDSLPAARIAIQQLRSLPGFEIENSLHPSAILDRGLLTQPRVLHLNYHAALHSQWTPNEVERAQIHGWKVIITYHDSGVPNSDQCQALYRGADAFVVHEPVDDLPGAYYWRQGVPAPEVPENLDGDRDWAGQPLVGTVGFPFPWKNYDLLVEAAREAGWRAVLIAPHSTSEQLKAWRAHGGVTVYPNFLPADRVGAILAGCDATAFLYSCANTGTSGAIRQGLATRKPVVAALGCRQFRDLAEGPGGVAINWTGLGVDQVAYTLSTLRLGIDPGIVYLAHRDSWRQLAARYRALYEELGA